MHIYIYIFKFDPVLDKKHYFLLYIYLFKFDPILDVGQIGRNGFRFVTKERFIDNGNLLNVT